ncbi:MAG: hypothetical protein R6W66_10505 [Pelovirga sp.]
MKRMDFEGMCQLNRDGQMVWVKNLLNQTAGRVVNCEAEAIEVQVGNHCEKWDHQICEELTHGYRVNYSEVKKYPHEYDTHLD